MLPGHRDVEAASLPRVGSAGVDGQVALFVFVAASAPARVITARPCLAPHRLLRRFMVVVTARPVHVHGRRLVIWRGHLVMIAESRKRWVV
jgi:hypothetical protein